MNLPQRKPHLVIVSLLVSCLALVGCEREPVTDGGPLQMRRLTEAQYRNTVRDIFGENIIISGRFEREQRVDGLLEISASQASITESGMEQFYKMAVDIAEQVMAEANRANILGCEPETPTQFDQACAQAFLTNTGRLLYRRSLREEEVDRWLEAARQATQNTGDFYQGMQVALSGMMVAPQFIFRMDTLTADATPTDYQLSGTAKASRLSFFLWNSTPDQSLLDAAEAGELDTEQGLTKQVDRLLASPKLQQGMTAFFYDFLALDHFAALQKDRIIYPVFNQKVALAAEEQMLRFISHHLLEKDADYRQLFTTRDTFMNRTLGMVYGVPVKSRDGWEAFSFPEQDPRAGLLAHVGFTALHSHPGRSSATLRGMAIREHLLCQPVAPAPAAVNFTVVQDTSHPELKTARERLTAHRTDPACVGCHKVIDPIGLALETFDGAGMYRETENGAPIDTSGELDGLTFDNPVELGQALHDHPGVPACLVDKTYRYAAGRKALPSEQPWLNHVEESFANNQYRLKALLRDIATSDNFYRVDEAAAQTALNNEASNKIARR